MDQEPLVEQTDAGEAFVRDVACCLSVAAAFWINPAESEEWYLYIASDEINDGNIKDAYGKVLHRLGAEGRQWLDPFRIKLLNSSDPLASEVVQIRDRYAAKIPTRYRGSFIGGMNIDGAYIYPPLAATNSMPQ